MIESPRHMNMSHTHTFCRSSAKWRDCIAFASQVKADYNSDCLCWGYKSLPSFGSDVSIGEATYLNGWCVSEFFSNGMTFKCPDSSPLRSEDI